MKNGNTALNRAIEILGGLSAAAAKLGVRNYQTIQQWRRGRVPVMHCASIERITDGAVTCEELRPDLAMQWKYLRRIGECTAGMQDGFGCTGR